MKRQFCLVSSIALVSCAGLLGAAGPDDIPTQPPTDAIMPSVEELHVVQRWARNAFAVEGEAAKTVRVECRRQDHSVLHFGQSCIDTTLRIGKQGYQHGLGTHANSELVLHLPAGATAFEACVGVDNNADTGGQRGSVVFLVEAAGRELYRSATLRGGQEPVPVRVPLPAGTRELVLKTDATADGPGYDQADWAEPRLLMENGTALWADEERPAFMEAKIPFSFVYGDRPSSVLLPGWEHTSTTKEEPTRTVHQAGWSDPKTGLRVSATVTVFKRFAAAEWVLFFENQGTEPTPILEHVDAVDASLRTGYARTPAILHRLTGDVCGEESFLPVETAVDPGQPVALAPVGGRPSNGAFPFFNLCYGDEGMITAIGWSGQWAASFERSSVGPTRLRAGMEKTHLRLQPGERIRSPRILVMPWHGDQAVAQNCFRRLLLFEYVPKLDGRPLRLPLALQCFDRYSGTRPEWATEAGQIRSARAAREVGCDTHWLDAAWFPGNFPNGVGNWSCKPTEFPHGLKPVSDACHQAGLNFIVWFEPERVALGTQIAREHPEFVFGGTNGGLFKLSEPVARRWLTDLLSARIQEYGIDCYRNDFNIDPLEFWNKADAPDRQGMTEIRYVEGHYAMWDELRERHPGLWIDNCASGGRRIDLETISRSVTLWRSDTGCSPGHADWDQVQVLGLASYLPLFASCGWEPKAYVMRSSASAGAICQFDFLDKSFSTEQARAALAELRTNQPYWYGDFYALTKASRGADAVAAWQLHRADWSAGLVLAFRRTNSPFAALQVNLRGLEPSADYQVEFIDEERVVRRQSMSGRDLMRDFELRLPRRGTSLLVRYCTRSR